MGLHALTQKPVIFMVRAEGVLSLSLSLSWWTLLGPPREIEGKGRRRTKLGEEMKRMRKGERRRRKKSVTWEWVENEEEGSKGRRTRLGK